MKKFVLLDTNILLHYKRLDQIDWLAETEASEVEILIAPVIMREMDKHKIQHPIKHIRDRATKYMKWLNSLPIVDMQYEIRSGVIVRFICNEPSIDFEAHQLSKDIDDDWLIAHAIEELPGKEASLSIIVADTGIRMKMLGKKIDVKLWADNQYKLEAEEDPEQRRIKELEDELRKHTSRMPKLSLVHDNEMQYKTYTLRKREQNNIDDEMMRTRQMYPEYGTDDAIHKRTYRTGSAVLDQFNILNYTAGFCEQLLNTSFAAGRKRYNSELPAFFERYENYLKDLYYFEGHVVPVGLTIENAGTCPAGDVLIHIELPSHLDVRDRYDVPVEPDPPKEPQPDENKLYMPTFHSSFYRNLSQPSVMLPEPNITGPELEASDMISFRIKKARQHVSCNLDPFYIVFDDLASAKNFNIAYTIIADNISDKVAGTLNVLIEKI